MIGDTGTYYEYPPVGPYKNPVAIGNAVSCKFIIISHLTYSTGTGTYMPAVETAGFPPGRPLRVNVYVCTGTASTY